MGTKWLGARFLKSNQVLKAVGGTIFEVVHTRIKKRQRGRGAQSHFVLIDRDAYTRRWIGGLMERMRVENNSYFRKCQEIQHSKSCLCRKSSRDIVAEFP